MGLKHFTRFSIAAAIALLALSQAKFDQMRFRLGFEAVIPFDTSLSVLKKVSLLVRQVAREGEIIVPTKAANRLSDRIMRWHARHAHTTCIPPLTPANSGRARGCSASAG